MFSPVLTRKLAVPVGSPDKGGLSPGVLYKLNLKHSWDILSCPFIENPGPMMKMALLAVSKFWQHFVLK